MDLSDAETKSFVKSVLTDAVVALCKNTLLFNALTIDGLLGITTDNSHFMLHIHHTQQKKTAEVEASENSSIDSSPSEATPSKAKKRKTDPSPETPEQVQTKTEVQSDSDDDVQFIEDYEELNVKQEPTHMHNENSSSGDNPVSSGTYPYETYTNISNIAANVSATYDSSHSSLQALYTNQQNISSNNSSFTSLPQVATTPSIPTRNLSHSVNAEESMSLQCPVCRKQLGSTSALSRHLKGHTSNAVLSCPVCSRAFNRKDNLKRHMDKQHQDYNGENAVGQSQTWKDMSYNVASADTIGEGGGGGQSNYPLQQTNQQ